MKGLETRYLEKLSELYPTIAKASKEIINLQAILNLPKGTEHFLTDIHGEYEAFAHVLKNGSGSVRHKIDEVFGNTMVTRDKQMLATLIYYPKEKMNQVKKQEEDMEEWYKIMLYRLIMVCKNAASKYTRSKVRKALPEDYAYVTEELITERSDISDKEDYYNSIVKTIIDIGSAEDFIIAMCKLIQRLAVDHLHILGDIYDRGPGPHLIMDELMSYHSVDVQWEIMICSGWVLRLGSEHVLLMSSGIEIDGKTYELLDKNFPTVDPADPYALTEEEADVIERLEHVFVNCEKLQKHMYFLLSKGALYKVYNNNLLYHGCVPLNEDGSLKEVCVYGKPYKGKSLYDILEAMSAKDFMRSIRKKKNAEKILCGISGLERILLYLGKTRWRLWNVRFWMIKWFRKKRKIHIIDGWKMKMLRI